ncbi:MAG: bifunctional phosphopantothenoylcysteine decarboxylase/phosphopantothenate--cysteine ligase CoaBC, partial [Ghiorsea sp.]|nr:bifunctional phosphopantothenoylcysteine decarboxylase/phosphopantothenate--cysteine ligase CoaBC [Ghiorsea sp.]
MLQGKRILLGVGGGIAVYRAVELMRLLVKHGAEVQVVMSKSATEFVTPLTFEALSGNKVHTDLFDLTEQHGMGHIQLVRWADVVVVAPATANLITKVARGIAEDLLTTLLLASEVPVLVAPAMNVSMWEAASNQANMNILRDCGFYIVEPVSGELACGEQGAGRLAEPETIVQATLPLLTEQTLAGQTWVINAGPTVEAWDAVRVLSNRATGTLGALLAGAAAVRGADVTLIAGKGTPPTCADVQRIDVESAAQMLEASMDAAKGVDVFVGTAAVSDFKFADEVQGKLKRSGNMQVALIENSDIIQAVAGMQQRPTKVIAFAAESENHVAYALDKLKRKGMDAIV